MTIHLRPDTGRAEVCPTDGCEASRYHFPDFDLAAFRSIPPDLLEPLINAVDPGTPADPATWQRRWPLTQPPQDRAAFVPNASITESAGSYWYDDEGKWHRDYDLPAVVLEDGSRAWYRHGQSHRANGPALINPARHIRAWRINGYLHRTDGPAIESDGAEPRRHFYWLGFELTRAEHRQVREILLTQRGYNEETALQAWKAGPHAAYRRHSVLRGNSSIEMP